MSERKPPPQRVTSSGWARSFRVTRMGMMGGARAAAHAVGNVFMGDKNRQARTTALWREQAAMWVREVGALKGTLMKAGQMLAMYGEHVLPPEAVSLLRSLQSEAPPLDFAAIRAVIAAELPAERVAELDIEPVPCGSASLGQVHRATLPTGEVVAVKVQYPGVAEALDSDLRALRRMMGMLRVVAGSETLDGLFDEIRKVMRDELDYIREREMTEWFGAALKGNDNFVVPPTYPAYSSAKVLTTRFESGFAPDGAEVLGLPLNRRNALCRNYFELYFRELFEFHRVQTDPHFGNFKVRLAASPDDRDRLVLLDFGAVRGVSDNYLKCFQRMVRGCLTDDRQMVIDVGLDLGLLRPGDSPVAENAFFDMARLIAEPYSSADTPGRKDELFDAEGNYDFGRSDLPKRVINRGQELARAVGLRSSPPESLFLDRKLVGVFLFLSTLKANFNGRALVDRFFIL